MFDVAGNVRATKHGRTLLSRHHVTSIFLSFSQIALTGADADSVPITQLPNVLLLTTTLWQGAPTSPSKCVFEKQTDFKPAALELNVVS